MAGVISSVVAVFNETAGSSKGGLSKAGAGYLRAVLRAGNVPRNATLTSAQRAARPELFSLGHIDESGWVTTSGRKAVRGS